MDLRKNKTAEQYVGRAVCVVPLRHSLPFTYTTMSLIFDDDPDEPRKLYSERKDWADVTPIPQYEGVNPIAPIFYTPECKFVYTRGCSCIR